MQVIFVEEAVLKPENKKMIQHVITTSYCDWQHDKRPITARRSDDMLDQSGVTCRHTGRCLTCHCVTSPLLY